MRSYSFLFFALIFLISCQRKEKNMPYEWPNAVAPRAQQKEHLRVIHNDTVSDPYYWLYDYFGKGPDSSKVVEYLNAENAYLKTMMAGTETLQTKLFEEMKARIKEKDESVPYFKNGYYYYNRTEDGQQYYKFCRRKTNMQAPEEILLDVDAMAKGKSYFSVRSIEVSPDNKLIAYGIDEVSRWQFTINVKNLETGEILSDKITNTEGNPVWAADNKTFFYTSKNPVTLLSEKIYRHTLGTPPTSDALVYEEKDKSNYIAILKSKNEKWIFIYSQNTLSTEIRFMPADKPSAAFEVFQPRMKDVLYAVTPLEDRFLIQTNADKAENFKVMECPLNATEKDNWKEFIGHKKEVLIEGLEEFRDFLVVQQRRDGLKQLEVRNLKDQTQYQIAFDEPTYDAGTTQNPNYESKTLRYSYTSLITPSSVFDHDLTTKERVLKKQQEVLGGFNKDDYKTERIYATARDGVKIPISLVYKSGVKINGTAPLLEYAYGSYGNSIDATFNSNRLSLLNRGFVYAIAHIRGGQEMGRYWYLDGRLMKKKNTFTDFIDCGKFLIEKGYAAAGHLYAHGGSAGGLLMGGIANMAPEQYKGILADVPFVDVVNTMLDESIPLTTNEYDEWGNPNEKDAYFYIKSYSPYENIESKVYPNILITTGLHDSQVQYFEPAKWVAKLRALKTDSNHILLKTNMDFGHGGASGRFDYLHDISLRCAFLLALEGKVKE